MDVLEQVNKVYSIEELRKILLLILKNNKEVYKIYLFGSYARGEATKNSDIDIYIIINNNVNLADYQIYVELAKKYRSKIKNIIKFKAFDILINNNDDFNHKKLNNKNLEYIVNKEGVEVYE